LILHIKIGEIIKQHSKTKLINNKKITIYVYDMLNTNVLDHKKYLYKRFKLHNLLLKEFLSKYKTICIKWQNKNVYNIILRKTGKRLR
jgi:hypothetical protein